MVLLGRIELPTSPLPRVRSTTELQQRSNEARAIVGEGAKVKAMLAASYAIRHARQCMATNGETPTREERLAAKLRENLRRRKGQQRAQTARAGQNPGDGRESDGVEPPSSQAAGE